MRGEKLPHALSRQVPLRAAVLLALMGAAIGGVAVAGRSAPESPFPEDLRVALLEAGTASECLHLADMERARAADSGASFDEAQQTLTGCDDELNRRVDALERPGQQGPVYTAVFKLYDIQGAVDHAIFHIEEDMKGVPTGEVDTTATALRDVDDQILEASALIES